MLFVSAVVDDDWSKVKSYSKKYGVPMPKDENVMKAYKELSTYNRSNKCSECEFEDSEYYCDDCIWNFVDKFKLKEVKADERR